MPPTLVLAAISGLAAASLSGCSTVVPSLASSAAPQTSTIRPTAPASTRAVPTATPRFDPAATDRIGVVVRGVLSTAGCIVLDPTEDSPNVPLGGLGTFEVHLPAGYEFVPDSPNEPTWGGEFQIRERSGEVVARSGQAVEIFADIPASWGSTCMAGQPLDALFIRPLEQRVD